MSQTVQTGQNGRRPVDGQRQEALGTAMIAHCACAVAPEPASRSIAAPSVPLHRAIVAVDVVASTARTNPARGQLRQAMYDMLDEALTRSGIAERHRDRTVDRGDGALVIVRPADQVPKTLLINTFIPTLSGLIDEHKADHGGYPFRLRAAVHAGEVHYDSRGPFGEALDIACRLVDAPELKEATKYTSAPLVLAVSDHIFQSVIKHQYSGADGNAYLPLLRVDIGGQEHRGWVSVPPNCCFCAKAYAKQESLGAR